MNNLIAINGFYLSLESQKILTKLSKENNCEIIHHHHRPCNTSGGGGGVCKAGGKKHVCNTSTGQ